MLWMMPLIIGALNADISVGALIAAEGDASATKKAKQKTRKVPAMREKTYKAIAEAQLLIENETPAEALPVLQKLLERKGLNAYELAQTWNMLAFAYYSLEDTKNTIHAYNQVLKQEKITLALELGTLRALFQLYYQAEDYKRALELIDRWVALNELPDAGVTYLKATAYYQLDQFENSLDSALKVVEIAESQQKTVKESWLYLLVILYNELKDYPKVINVLERLIVEYPKKQYWMHLAGLYGETDQETNALAAYYAAYTQDMFKKNSEIIMLSQRLLNAEVPYEAASVLQKGIDDGIVDKNEKNMKLLGQAWTMAQETEKAIKAWKSATEFANNGEIFYRLAQALANDDQHQNAVTAYRDALEQGGLKKPQDVEFWLGISLMQLENWEAAKVAFRAASKDKKKAKQCRQYIRYIDGEKRRQSELKKMLEA
jgi:tetratricopeptide (TPR) repeat protein